MYGSQIAQDATRDVGSNFKTAMGRHASSVTIITTVDDEDCPHGFAATAFSSVSMEPASALICVNRSASASPVIKRSGLFCVNLLEAMQEDISACFSRSDMRSRRFSEGNWNTGPHGLRYLTDAQAAIFCEVVREIEHGTHTIIVGNVLDVRLAAGQSPLVYCGGRYKRLIES